MKIPEGKLFLTNKGIYFWQKAAVRTSLIHHSLCACPALTTPRFETQPYLTTNVVLGSKHFTSPEINILKWPHSTDVTSICISVIIDVRTVEVKYSLN